MYSFTSRIRFSEVDTHLNLTLGSVIDYFQDCSTFHSEAVGMNIARLSAMKRAWILSSWQIVPVRFPKLGEKVTISTWPYDFHGFFGYRNFTMTGEDGECLVYANSIWIYMDTDFLPNFAQTYECNCHNRVYPFQIVTSYNLQ